MKGYVRRLLDPNWRTAHAYQLPTRQDLLTLLLVGASLGASTYIVLTSSTLADAEDAILQNNRFVRSCETNGREPIAYELDTDGVVVRIGCVYVFTREDGQHKQSVLLHLSPRIHF